MGAAADGPPAGDVVPVHRFDQVTDDPEQAVEIIRAAYAGIRTRISGPQYPFRYEQHTATAGPLTVDAVTSKIGMDFACPPYDYLWVATGNRGQASFRVGTEQVQMGAGDTIACPVGETVTASTRDSDMRVLRLPLAPVAAHAGLDADTFRITALTPTSTAMGRHVSATLHYLHRALQDPDTALAHPLVLAAAMDLMVPAVLAAFPPTGQPADTHPGRILPTAVRRAVAFIDAHPDQPLTLADIAAATGVSVHALRYGFRRHLDTTPARYLRRVRLTHAHHDLQNADPAGGGDVAPIARRWGFGNPDRFADDYRTAYGRPPSETLHH
jgi:AraC-like DNA-binding protein